MIIKFNLHEVILSDFFRQINIATMLIFMRQDRYSKMNYRLGYFDSDSMDSGDVFSSFDSRCLTLNWKLEYSAINLENRVVIFSSVKSET